MKLILSLGSLYTMPAEFAMDVARESGFEGVEWVYNSFTPVERAKRVSSSMPILSVHAPFIKSRMIKNLPSGLSMAVEFAKGVGAKVVVVHPPCLVDPQIRYLLFFLFTRDFSRKFGKDPKISLENMPYWGKRGKKFPAYLGGTIGGLYKLCKKKRLFITFDVCHLGTKYPDKIVEAFNILYKTGRIVNIHFSDYREGCEHLIPGSGMLPLEDFLVNLGRSGYDGLLTLELRPQVLPKEKEEVVSVLRKVRNWVLKKIEAGRLHSKGPESNFHLLNQNNRIQPFP